MSFVAHRIRTNKIRHLQLDPFGFCNAKCWYCPVKYYPQPEEGAGVMSPAMIETIFADLVEERNKPDGVVDRSLTHITFSHYNEILLYKHFDELMELCRKYGFKTYLMSNGVSLTKQRVDTIKQYSDVVVHLGLNIPAFEKDLWAKRAGFDADQFERLINNVTYAAQELRHLGSELQIGVNGIDRNIVNNGYVTLGEKFSELDYNLDAEHERQHQLGKAMFPTINVHKASLYDRTGLIDHMMTNKPHLKKLAGNNKTVVGCNNWGDRSIEWLNINSAGSVFLCCNDYNFDYKFGDLTKQSIREVWQSQLHIDVIEKAYKEICTNCLSARWSL